MVFANWYSVLISFSSGIILLSLSWKVYREKQVIGHSYFWILLFLFSIICLIFGINNLGIFFPGLGHYPLSLHLYWIYYSSFYVIPVVWLVYCLKYTGRSEIISRKLVLILSIVPSIMVLLRFYQFWGIIPFHLFPVSTALLPQAILSFGHLYLYALGFFGIILLLVQFRSVSEKIRYQTAFLTLGMTIPIIHEFISEGNLLTSGLDVAVSGLFLAFGILYCDMLIYTPVFREYFYEIIDSGLLVLNERREILDMNPVAEGYFRVSRKEAFTKKTGEIGTVPAEFRKVLESDDITGELPHFCISSPIERWFRISARWVPRRFSSDGVYLLTINDITTVVSLEKEVAEQKMRLLREEERSRKEFRYLLDFNSSKNAIMLISQGLIIRCNPAAEALAGKSQEELAGTDPVLLSAPVQKQQDDVPEKFRFFLADAASGTPVLFPWVFRFVEGDVLTEISLRRLTWRGRVIVEMSIRVLPDIS
jgi:PAS domain-containing protein